MDLKVPFNQMSGPTEAYNLAKELITPEYIDKWKVKADVSMNDSNQTMEAKGKGFTLSLAFVEGECHVNVKLSLLLKPLRGKILSEVEKKLSRHI